MLGFLMAYLQCSSKPVFRRIEIMSCMKMGVCLSKGTSVANTRLSDLFSPNPLKDTERLGPGKGIAAHPIQ